MTFAPKRDLKSVLTTCALLAIFVGAAGRIHFRVETTLIGYELGELKSQEGELLESRSKLKMQLAKLSSRQHLTLMSGTGKSTQTALKSVALK